MMFGHVETHADRIEHLERLRRLQDETHGFTAFICWTFQPGNTALGDLSPFFRGGDYRPPTARRRDDQGHRHPLPLLPHRVRHRQSADAGRRSSQDQQGREAHKSAKDRHCPVHCEPDRVLRAAGVDRERGPFSDAAGGRSQAPAAVPSACLFIGRAFRDILVVDAPVCHILGAIPWPIRRPTFASPISAPPGRSADTATRKYGSASRSPSARVAAG